MPYKFGDEVEAAFKVFFREYSACQIGTPTKEQKRAARLAARDLLAAIESETPKKITNGTRYRKRKLDELKRDTQAAIERL